MDLVAMVFKFLGFHQHMEHQMVALPALDGSLVVVAVVLKLLLRAVMVALVVAAVATWRHTWWGWQWCRSIR